MIREWKFIHLIPNICEFCLFLVCKTQSIVEIHAYQAARMFLYHMNQVRVKEEERNTIP